MYKYEKMTPKEIMKSFEQAVGDVVLPDAISEWYYHLTARTSPRFQTINTVETMEKAFREYKKFCVGRDCEECQFGDKELGTAECFKMFLEEEV